MAFMLDQELGVEAARKVADRAIKAIPMADDQEKLNVWTAYMNLENNFGDQTTLEGIIKRALEQNDRRKIYLNLIDIYRGSFKYKYIEPIYTQLVKKFSSNVDIWASYLDYLVYMNKLKEQGDENFMANEVEVTEPKKILGKARQALP
jgi:rRNA biogenesis protein RRP5